MKGRAKGSPSGDPASTVIAMDTVPPSLRSPRHHLPSLRSPRHRHPSLLVAVLLAVLLTLLPGVSGTASAAVPGQESGLPVVALSSLPPEATRTHRLIRAGGPFPYDRDGITFQNREGLLPAKARGYYREYTVDTPGLNHRGARRLVTGSGGEVYYTRDHYASFVVVDVSR